MFTMIAVIAFDAVIKKRLLPSVMLGWGVFAVSTLTGLCAAYLVISGYVHKIEDRTITALVIFDGYLTTAFIVSLAIMGVVAAMKKLLKKADEEYLDSR